jgi:hypothetical protein
VKQISALIIGFAGFAAAFAIAPALAEDLTAGKTPAQLFRSDCGACHRSPNGLVKERGNVSGLTSFLREHYTTKAESAAALAAYVSGLASPGGSARTGRGDRRSRNDGDAPVATAVPADPAAAEDPPRRRRAASPPDDGGRRQVRDNGDAPRPPRGVGTGASPAGSDAAARASQPREGTDPLTRLRSYLSSGQDSGSASAQAARTGAPKARKRHSGTDETAAGAPAPARVNGDAPAAPAEPAPRPRPDAPAETVREEPAGEPK